ncbi:MAG TPA: O-antigen ligase family protein, partial [Syntrophales bacterium]|nr:O-antigen ligase family protein [Syntrophales bacterium]
FLCILAASLLLIPGRFLRREYPNPETPGADTRSEAGEDRKAGVRADAGDRRDLPVPDAPAGRRGDEHRAGRRGGPASREEEGARHDLFDGIGRPARPGAPGRLVFVWPLAGMTPLFILLTIFLIFQMTPLPDFLISVLSPEAKVAGLASLPAPRVVAAPWPGDVWYSVAPYAYPVRMSLIRWTAYGLFFFGLLQTLRTRRRIETAVLAILFTAAFDSLYGIMETYSRHHHVWWYLHATEKSVHGTYINRNHFAGLMEMGMIMAAAYAGAYAAALARRSSHRRPDLRERILTFFSGDGIFTRRFLIIFMGAVMGVGLILSASRGGIMAGAVGLFVLGVLLFLRREQRRKGKIILAIFLIVAFYSLPAGIDYVVGRFQVMDRDYESRLLASQKTLDIYKDYRRSGVGVGNFPYAFPKYQDERQKMTSYEHGHNDWAQLLAEAGVAGMLVTVAAGLWFVYVYMSRWRRRRSTFAVCLGAGGIASLTAILVHSVADFNLHLPANFLLLAATLTIGTAALHLDRVSHHEDVLLLPGTSLPLRGAGAVPLVLLLGLILWNGQGVIRHYLAEIYCPTVPNMTLNLDWSPPPADIARAMRLDGGNAEYAFRMAMALTEIRNQEAAQNGSATPAWAASHGSIIVALERSARLNPFNAEAHKCLGWEYTYLTADPDYGRIWLP